MLRKLLKHEFRATGRIMLPLFGILLLVSVGANFSSRGMLNSDSSLLRTLGTIFIMLFIVGIFAVGIISFVLMINRFYKNLLQDEGYVMIPFRYASTNRSGASSSSLPSGSPPLLW